MAECPACGNVVNEGEAVCSECGTDLSSLVGAVEEVVAETAVETPPEPVQDKAPGAKLTLIRGGELTATEYPIGEFVTIGRFDPSTGPVDIDLGDLPEASYVSRIHAEVKRDDAGTWSIKDLESNNGTYIKPQEEQKYTRTEGEQAISSGDDIALGNVRFRFTVTEKNQQ